MIQQNLKERILTSFILLFLVFFAFNYNFFLVYLLIVFGVISFIEFSNLIKKILYNRYFFLPNNNLFFQFTFLFYLI